MNTSPAVPLFSPTFQEMAGYIDRIKAPYTLQDIKGFNTLYKRAYASLNRNEKRRIEAFVDTMIDHVERPEFAEKIFGVV